MKRKAASKPKGKTGGRPATVMTAAAIKSILGFVSDGLRFNRAAEAAGVDPAIARVHRSRNASFKQEVAIAEATYERELLVVIRQSAGKSWQAAAWHLERRWPELYATPAVQLNTTTVTADAEQIVKGIAALIQIAEDKHNPPGAKDVDANDAVVARETAQ